METIQKEASSHAFPHIYLGSIESSKLDGFNAVSIYLDARLDSDLNWEKQIELANSYRKKGFKILWEMHFGLFKELHLPLSDTSQYRSLNLAIDYFFESILKNFESDTVGIAIFKGSLDFSHDWLWEVDQVLNFRGWLSDNFRDHHSFTNQVGTICNNLLEADPNELAKNENGKNLLRFYCVRAAVDYFALLTSRFESDLLPYLLIDATSLKSSAHVFQLLDQEDFEFIQLALKNAPFESHNALGWESNPFVSGYIGKEHKTYQKPHIEAQVGIVIPISPIFDCKEIAKYDIVIEKIKLHKPIKLISERNITVDWQGLEELIVLDVEQDSKRKLEGFIAAGGEVITDNKLNLSLESPLKNYLKSLEKS